MGTRVFIPSEASVHIEWIMTSYGHWIKRFVPGCIIKHYGGSHCKLLVIIIGDESTSVTKPLYIHQTLKQ